MSVMAVFNMFAESELTANKALDLRKRLHLRGKQLFDEKGTLLAELVDTDIGPRWKQLHKDSETSPVAELCQEIAFVGQGRLNQ